jgi:enoyl-CoA hydratase/carnithine racemase
MPFVDLGLTPEAGSSLLAPQRFGRVRASQYLLLCEPFDAEAARDDGLVNAVVDAAALHAHALAATKPPCSRGWTRKRGCSKRRSNRPRRARRSWRS